MDISPTALRQVIKYYWSHMPWIVDPLRGNAQILFHMNQAGIRIVEDVETFGGLLGLPTGLVSHHVPDKVDWPNANNLRNFPDWFDSESNTLAVLAGLIKQFKPEIVIETGVANGVSTKAILDSLTDVGSGELYSFDIDARCAKVAVGHRGENRWRFRQLTSKNPMAELKSAVQPLKGRVALWYHDSDHHYDWQSEEFKLAFDVMAPNGILISDDVDANIAFAELAQNGRDSLVCLALFDKRKVIGASMRNAQD